MEENNQEPTLAQILKKARENAHLDLKQMSDVLKIPSKYLNYLEKGDYEKLPGKAYIFGFINKYAKVLSLNKDELVAQYKKERPEPEKEEPLPLLRYPRFLITPKLITYFFIILGLLLVFFYLWRQINFLAGLPTLIIESPSQEIVETPNLEIKGLTDPKIKLTINDQEVYVNENGDFQKDVFLQPGLNTFFIKAINSFGKEKTITKNLWLTTKK